MVLTSIKRDGVKLDDDVIINLDCVESIQFITEEQYLKEAKQ